MEKKSFEDYGIQVEQGVNEDAPTSAVSDLQEKGERSSKLFFSEFANYDVNPEHPDQSEAIKTDPSEMLRSLRASNIEIEEIPADEAEKFGLKDHPLHTDHLRHAA